MATNNERGTSGDISEMLVASRNVDDRHLGPQLARPLGKLGTVHATGQIDIGEQHVDVGARLDIAQRFVRRDDFVHAKAGLAQTVRDKIADHHFVFDQQNRNSGRRPAHSLLSPSVWLPPASPTQAPAYENLLHFGCGKR